MNKFLMANIDRAIVVTQCDLRGFWHPLGFREEKGNPKSLDATTANLVAFAAGGGQPEGEGSGWTVENRPDYWNCSYEDYLAMCKQFAGDCDEAQKEAIQLIVLE